MKTAGNTILITGGGSGIGRGLAEAFHSRGNQVTIAGRSQATLDKVTSATPGIKSLALDIADPASITQFAAQIRREYPALNVLINNAGMMRPENLLAESPGAADAAAMIATNLLGPIRLTAALLPLLREQPSAAIVNNTSGLAFLPLAMTPTYSATKAALHSYTESLRYQLRETAVQVIELPPPYVATELMGEGQAADPRAMPLKDFIAQVMQIFESQPEAQEILVEAVKPLRFAAQSEEKYRQIFYGLNDSMH